MLRKDISDAPADDSAAQLRLIRQELSQRADPVYRQGLLRFAIPIEHALGVSMLDLKRMAKAWRGQHRLALALWDEGGSYEARLLAALIDDPKQVTSAQMDRWCADFDNWGICDTACFALFDRTPWAFDKVDAWATSPREFVRRAAFALLASLTVHDKNAVDAQFIARFGLNAAAANDSRNFVKKAVNWALRSIGKRNLVLHAAALELAEQLAQRPDASARWIGKNALRELAAPTMIESVTQRTRKSQLRATRT